VSSECTAIIAVKNGANYLEEAIASIRAQTFPVSRVIVVDDHSEDNSEVLCAELGVEFVKSNGIGQGAATNLGITISLTPFIAILDHDDRWDYQKTELQIKYLLKNSQAQAVFSRVQNFYTNGSVDREFLPSRALGSSIFRRQIFQKAGLFDVSTPALNSLPWWLEVARRGIRVDSLDIPALYRRVHEENFNVLRFDEAHHSRFSVLRSKIKLGLEEK